ncbi:MAG: hypothetical protein ACOYEB_10815 [Enterococcus lemanii]|jgi:hypothetical protein
MAYVSGYNGDQVALKHIVNTMNAKDYLIPGVIVNPALSYTVMGETAFFYTKGASTLDASHSLGAGSSTTVKGGKRINIDITTGGRFDFVIPGPELKTAASVDVKTRYIIEETIRLLNARQEAGLTAILAGAEAKTYAKGSSAFVAITNGLATFKSDNKQTALKPTGILVSSAFWAELLQDNKYIRSTDRADLKVFDGQILEIAGIPVIEAPDLANVDFVIVNANGVAAPINIASFKMVPADMGGGTAYIGGERGLGEIGFNFKVVTKSDDYFLATAFDSNGVPTAGGYYVAKFTEASS